jgi:toxin HigB-1
MTIRSFRCADTQAIYDGKHPRRFRNIEAVAQRKLQMLDDAVELRDLRSPPGNRLEMLTGNRAGQHSIRINDQWRVCFVWTDTGPESVEIVDYH